MNIRSEVLAFAEEMEKRLEANDHKGGWLNCTTRFLSEKLLEEVAELLLSINSQDLSDTQLVEIFSSQLGRLRKGSNILGSPTLESVDVGNVAMMFADKRRRQVFHWVKDE